MKTKETLKKHIYKKLEPFLLPLNHLYLLQLEEYKVLRYLKASFRHIFPINIQKVRKLVWTNKAKWLFGVSLLWNAITSVIVILIFSLVGIECTASVVGMTFVSMAILYFLFPQLWLSLAVLTRKPLEWFNRRRVITLTRRRVLGLKEKGLKVIGITGSYGKTTTKFFIHSVLQNHIPTYATPKSYNTLFGIAAPTFKHDIVADTLSYLPEETEAFIVEMGAYVKGEIAELCEAFPPDVAVLTGIAPVHLERFKSLENVINAKSELLEALESNGIAFINIDNEYTPRIVEKYKSRINVFTYGKEKGANIRFQVKELNINSATCKVHVDVINERGREIKTNFTFITNVNNPGMITNLGPAIGLGVFLGMSVEQIQTALENINMPESRMQVIKSSPQVTIINNGYNSNPISFANSIETLNMWESSYKVFVTPGIYELGEETYSIHKQMGKLFKDSKIDQIVLLGPVTDAIKGIEAGLREIKFPLDKVKHMQDITQVIPRLLKEKQVPATVLFENDVPDHYS